MGGPGGYSIVNSSNTFADVLPGVSINALQADESKPITLKVTPDSAGQTAQVKAMVDAVNNALSHIAANSIYNVEAKTGGPLVGDSLARNLQAKIRSEEHTSELQSLMRISYAVFCLKTKKTHNTTTQT